MKLTQEVLEVLSTCDVHAYSVQITAGQLDRKLYLKVNEALEALGGKWNRKAKAHMFEADPTIVLDDAILTGEVEAPKDLDFFATPVPLAKYMVERLGDIKGANVLEPSAGEGAIAHWIKQAGGKPWCIELNRQRATGLLKLFGPPVLCMDFLLVSPGDPFAHGFDAVCMNPPFSKRQDILHVQHALKFLQPGGKLVSVMSAGVTFRQDKLTKAFRALVEDVDGDFTKLPEGSFKDSGTNVNAVICMMVKR